MSSENARKFAAAAKTFRDLGFPRGVAAVERLLRLENQYPRHPGRGGEVCVTCDQCGAGFKTRDGDHMCFGCAEAEYREARENADADFGDMERKGAIEEELMS